jgi:UDP-glucose 4-epimerase
MRCLVTGVAGFIGSHLAEHLLNLGHIVVGIDCFTTYYDPRIKQANLRTLRADPRFHFVDADLGSAELAPLLEDVDYVFHQAAQAGVRSSWGDTFAEYARHNVLATQRLLEALKGRPLRKVVYASSSSVYGNARLPMRETARPQPVSPYGVTKLAAEHLCMLYHANYGVPVVALRYFTVYGPRQRPDMGIYKFIRAVAAEEPIPVYGDGRQTRDFTYVDDIVRANVLAALAPAVGAVVNIGGGSRIVLRDLLAMIQDTVGQRAQIVHMSDQKGDVGHTAADCGRARRLMGFAPNVEIPEGLRRQVAWQLETDHLAIAI